MITPTTPQRAREPIPIPKGPDVAPLVSGRLTRLAFQPLTSLIFDLGTTMPLLRAALSLKSGMGTVAN